MNDYTYQCIECGEIKSDSDFEKTGASEVCLKCEVADDSTAPMRLCEDCLQEYNDIDGRFYKYESGIWLCDACHDERLEE